MRCAAHGHGKPLLPPTLLFVLVLAGRTATTPAEVGAAAGSTAADIRLVLPRALRGGEGSGSGSPLWRKPLRAAPVSQQALLNNRIVQLRNTADAHALCAIIGERHREFNSVNFVTAFRALLNQIPAESEQHMRASSADEAEAAHPAEAWRAKKAMGSELDRSARAALKECKYELAASLARRAMLAFREASCHGLERAARMEKGSRSLYRRSLSLLGNSTGHKHNATAEMPSASLAADAHAPLRARLDTALEILSKGITRNIRDFDARQCGALLHVINHRKRAANSATTSRAQQGVRGAQGQWQEGGGRVGGGAGVLVHTLLRRVAAVVQQLDAAGIASILHSCAVLGVKPRASLMGSLIQRIEFVGSMRPSPAVPGAHTVNGTAVEREKGWKGDGGGGRGRAAVESGSLLGAHEISNILWAFASLALIGECEVEHRSRTRACMY